MFTVPAGMLRKKSAPSPSPWAIDATSGKGVPANEPEWEALIAAAGIVGATSGVPVSLWLLQEAAGPFADSIGSAPLTQAGTWTNQDPVTGWSRLGVRPNTGAGNSLISTAVGNMEQSQLLLAYVLLVDGSGSNQSIMGLGSTAHPDYDTRSVLIDAGGRFGVDDQYDTQYSATNHADGVVIPVALHYSVPAQEIYVFADGEIYNFGGTWHAASGATSPRAFLGDVASSTGWNSAGATVLYAALFEDAAADKSHSDITAMLAELGW